ASGLGPNNHWFSQENLFPGGADVPGTQENHDQFGSTFAAGDFNGDGRDDLAVGSPDEDDDVSEVKDSGAVTVLYGTPTGLSPDNSQLITQDGFVYNGPDIPSAPEAYDYFGRGLAAGDFNGDGRDDLAIGAASEGVQGNTILVAGVVHILYGGGTGLAATGNQLYSQGTSDDNIKDQSEEGDYFGAALAAGDLNGDGTNDLVIGIPGKSFDETTSDPKFSAGAIQVIHAGGTGLSDANEFEWQGTRRQVRALLTDVQWEEAYGVGDGALFLKMPSGEPPTGHVASVTKVMTLLLAVEELTKPNSPYSLDDDVTISALAADTDGSRMGETTGYPPLAENDGMPLELLLYGMMLESCNKSAVAIAQHLTGETDGFGSWSNKMNQRAHDLGMTKTLYTNPSGGCITTPQDQVTLWRHAWQYPLFRQLVSEKLYDNCGTNAQGLLKCYVVVKFGDSGYPGLEGWKSGNVGSGPQLGLPWVTEAVVRQATRLDRSLIVALAQTKNKETDGDNLFDYGYRFLFTPDYRGGHQMNAPAVRDFTVRPITDTLSFTAMIDTQNFLRVHTWQVVAYIRQVAPLGNAALTFNDIAGGTNSVPATLLD
ncbi:MAG: hypothetical protein ACREUU_19025, partial [Gammaproteobacteria bacterium]